MKRIVRKAVIFLVMTLMIGCLAGFPTKVSAAALNASAWNATCADKGKTKTLAVTGAVNGKYKYNGTWNPITWRSSDRNVATVDRNGNVKITGNKVGSAIITASCT